MQYSNTNADANSSSCSRKPVSGGSNSGPGRHSVYKGVRRRSSGKWVSEIREPKKPTRIWLGTFPTPEMAAIAFDVAALALQGGDAELNFPNSAFSFPLPASTLPRDIQAAAARAAAAVGAATDALSETDDNMLRNTTVEPDQIPVVNEFIDEDMIFDMPSVIDNMAEGMLLSPPRFAIESDDFAESFGDHNLWKF